MDQKDKIIDTLASVKRELVDILVGTDQERHKAFKYCTKELESVIDLLTKEVNE